MCSAIFTSLHACSSHVQHGGGVHDIIVLGLDEALQNESGKSTDMPLGVIPTQ